MGPPLIKGIQPVKKKSIFLYKGANPYKGAHCIRLWTNSIKLSTLCIREWTAFLWVASPSIGGWIVYIHVESLKFLKPMLLIFLAILTC